MTTAMETVPSAAPNDAIMAPPAEIAEATAWVGAVFGGVKRPADQPGILDLLFSSTEPPFSFAYGGTPSANLLKIWQRTFEKKESGDRTEHTVCWTDAATGLRVTAVVATFKRYPAVDWVLHFENKGAADTPIIENIQALDVQLNTGQPDRAAVLHQIAGDNCSAGSFRPADTKVEAGKTIRLAPVGGRSSNGTFPFFNFAAGDQGIIAAIGWSGQWAASIERSPDGPTRLRAGMGRTRLLLHPGERIRSPRILLLPWKGDLTAAHNRFRRLMLFHYVPKQDGKPVLLPTFLQGYDRYNGHPTWPTEAGQINAARIARDIGCEFLWLDAAWFPGGFPNGVGSWVANNKFPNGLKPVSDACHQMGLKFIVWFEPERVARGSQIAKEHPEFVHGGAGGGLFKLDDPAARRWLTDLLLKRIEEYGLDWYRNDFNMDPLENWRKADAPDRQGMTEIRYIEGLYEMWDELIARRPGLVVDNCASGGRRIDLEMCMRSVPLWQSDISCQKGAEDAHQAQSCALSLYVPFHTPCAWFPTAYELRSTATAGLVIQFPFLEPEFPAQQARELVEEGKANRRFWYGDLYPLTPISQADDQCMAFELYRPDLGEGIVLAFRRARCASPELALTLQGLDPAKKYWVWSHDGSVSPAVQTGDEWMKNGIAARLPGPRTSDVICFRDASLGRPDGLQPPGEFRLKDAKISSDPFTVTAALAWEPSAGAKRYRVLVAETPDCRKAVSERSVAETAVALPGLPPGKQLYWKVEAMSAGGAQANAGGPGSFSTPALADMKGVVFASDMQWTKATAGADNQVHRDTNLKGNPIAIGGRLYQKALWTHAFNDNTPADILFDLSARKFVAFKATVGLDDLGEKGSVQFQVLVDGQKKAETPVLRPRETRPLAVDVTGAKEIILRVLNGGDGYGWDQAVWGFARFIEDGAQDPMKD